MSPTNLSSKEIVLKAFVDFSLKFNHSSKMCKIFSSIISPTVNQHLALQLPCSHNCRLSASLWLVNKAGSFMQCVFCLFFGGGSGLSGLTGLCQQSSMTSIFKVLFARQGIHL